MPSSLQSNLTTVWHRAARHSVLWRAVAPAAAAWRAAEDAVARATTAGDVSSDDRQAEQVMGESVVVRGLGTAIAGIAHAWTSSRARDLWTRLSAGHRRADVGGRIYLAGCSTLTAAITSLVLRSMAPAARTPLTWILPVVAAVLGSGLMLATGRRSGRG